MVPPQDICPNSDMADINGSIFPVRAKYGIMSKAWDASIQGLSTTMSGRNFSDPVGSGKRCCVKWLRQEIRMEWQGYGRGALRPRVNPDSQLC